MSAKMKPFPGKDLAAVQAKLARIEELAPERYRGFAGLIDMVLKEEIEAHGGEMFEAGYRWKCNEPRVTTPKKGGA